MDLSLEKREEVIRALKVRFEQNLYRHEGLDWANIQAKLEGNTIKIGSLNEMELTGG